MMIDESDDSDLICLLEDEAEFLEFDRMSDDADNLDPLAEARESNLPEEVVDYLPVGSFAVAKFIYLHGTKNSKEEKPNKPYSYSSQASWIGKRSVLDRFSGSPQLSGE